MRVVESNAGQLGELTQRECDVLRRLARGASNKTIAFELGVGVSAVKGHVANMTDTLRISGRVQLTIWAIYYPECVEGVAVPLALVLPFEPVTS